MINFRLGDIPPGENPFDYDRYHMGVNIGTNVMVMMPNHQDEVCPYLIIVNTDNGQRMCVQFKRERMDVPSA
jgi:hypothetical protein